MKKCRLVWGKHHQLAVKFTVRKWWKMVLCSAAVAGFGLIVIAPLLWLLFHFHLDDSSLREKCEIVLLVLLWTLGWYDLFIFLVTVVALGIWKDTLFLIFDGEGNLILQSALFDQRLAINEINTVVILLKRTETGGGLVLGSRACFGDGKLILSPFPARDGFLQALSSANQGLTFEYA